MVFWIAIGLYFAAMFCGDPWDKEEWRATSWPRRIASLVLIAAAAYIFLPAAYDRINGMSNHDILMGIVVTLFLVGVSVAIAHRNSQ